jgi:hypothetical protein
MGWRCKSISFLVEGVTYLRANQINHKMNNKLITILVVLLCSAAYSQNIFSDGNRVFTDSSHSSYTRYEIKGSESYFVTRSLPFGHKTRSGNVSVLYEGIPNHFYKPILFSGHHIVYATRRHYDVSVGEELYRIYYRVISNELDGLHNIDGVEFYPKDRKTIFREGDQYAVIAGNIVDTPNDDLSWEGAGFALDYRMWLHRGLNVRIAGGFPLPETHKEEDLYFDLETMVQIFLKDYQNHLIEFYKSLAIWGQDDDEIRIYANKIFRPITRLLTEMDVTAIFEKLESGVIAKAYGIDDDENIIIKVDPDQWLNADFANRWYILYHELGHDVLNFRHGQGGRMMFNYPTKKYSWEDFFNDRDEMFLKALNKDIPQALKDVIQPMWSNY